MNDTVKALTDNFGLNGEARVKHRDSAIRVYAGDKKAFSGMK